MKASEIMLTISILVSGEPERARRCLQSLDQLRASVNCELLITDTGCDEETKQVIAEYADRVLYFAWCKDFSKARNLGLQEARGKWFLYLDDDEWFEDTQEIIDFFNNGEYQHYYKAYYLQRNYEDAAGSRYVDMPVGRMIRKTTETTFIYSIHECLHPPGTPEKYFGSYVHHYGYVFPDWNAKLAKHNRNIELLLKEREAHPEELHHLMQLVQEYFSSRRYEESLTLSEEGIAIWQRQRDDKEYFYINYLYASVGQCLLRLERYEEVVQRCEEFLKSGMTGKITDIVLHGRLVKAYFELKDYAQCIDWTKNYLELYEDYQVNPEAFLQYSTSINNVGVTPGMLHTVLSCGIGAAIKMQAWRLAQQWSELLVGQNGPLYMDGKLLDEIVSAMHNEKTETAEVTRASAIEICNVFLRRPEIAENISRLLRACPQKNWNLYMKLNSDHWYISYLKLCCLAEQGQDCQESSLWDMLWQEPEAAIRASEELKLWEFIKRAGRNVKVELQRIPYNRWCRLIERWSEEASGKNLSECLQQLCEATEELDERIAFWQMVCLRKDLEQGVEGAAQRERLLEEYVQLVDGLYGELYSEEVVQYYFERLPLDYQLALLFSGVMEAQGSRDWAGAVQLLGEVKNIYPKTAEFIKSWLKEIKEMSGQSFEEQVEFLALARQVKDQARTLLASGQPEMALPILEQLEQMMPGDAEIAELKKAAGK